VSDVTIGRLITAGIVVAAAVALWIVGKVLKRKLPERWAELVGQLVPVLITAVVVVGALVVIDPDQADQLLQSLIQSVPKVMIALIVVIIARALGRIVGLFIEAGLRPVSAVLGGRARLIASGAITGIGVVIAMQQLGVSADIILVLVAALAFGTAIAMALGVGLGSVPLARQVAAGRHVAARYSPGERVRVGDVHGMIEEIGLVSSRVRTGDSAAVDIPNAEFIEAAVNIEA